MAEAATMKSGRPTVTRAAPRKPDDGYAIEYRLVKLPAGLDGGAGTLRLGEDAPPGKGDGGHASLLHMLEETVQVWADEARQISDDLPTARRRGKAVA